MIPDPPSTPREIRLAQKAAAMRARHAAQRTANTEIERTRQRRIAARFLRITRSLGYDPTAHSFPWFGHIPVIYIRPEALGDIQERMKTHDPPVPIRYRQWGLGLLQVCPDLRLVIEDDGFMPPAGKREMTRVREQEASRALAISRA